MLVVPADRQLEERRRQVVARVAPVQPRMRHQDHEAAERKRQEAGGHNPVGDPDPARMPGASGLDFRFEQNLGHGWKTRFVAVAHHRTNRGNAANVPSVAFRDLQVIEESSRDSGKRSMSPPESGTRERYSTSTSLVNASSGSTKCSISRSSSSSPGVGRLQSVLGGPLAERRIQTRNILGLRVRGWKRRSERKGIR